MNKERLLLAGSLALNLLLLFLWLGGVAERREESAETSPEIAAATPGAAAVEETTSVATTATATLEPMPTETLPAPQVVAPTATPDASPTEEAADAPTVASTPTPASTPEPTSTPVPPTETPVPQPEWLSYLNGFREEANLPPLVENGAWSAGSLLHNIYMVKTDEIVHSQRVASGWYSEEGYQAAVNGNIAATVWDGATAQWAIDYWMTAPFHALPILDPQLTTVGFGFHREESEGIMAAGTMQLLEGFVPEPADESIYPVLFPRDGGPDVVEE